MSDLRLRFPEPCGEAWEDMKSSGCNRRCEACATVVHDLTQYDVAGIEVLLRSGTEVCARAMVRRDGTIATRPGLGMRRAVALLAVPLALVGASAEGRTDRPHTGSIVGEIDTFGFKTYVTVKDSSGNVVKTVTARRNGRYRIKNLPKGSYTLEFNDLCSEPWRLENVVVTEGETLAPHSESTGGCIIVGKLEIADDPALG